MTRRLAALIAVGIAAAASAAPPPAQTLAEELGHCAQLQDRARRLSCYDHLAADAAGGGGAPERSTQAATSPVPATSAALATSAASATHAARAAAAEAEFGVSEGPLAAKRQDVALAEIGAKVTRIASRPRGELVITLENGQVWQQNEPNESFVLKVGDEVHIKSGALSSYIMTTPYKRGAKVTRIR